MTTRVLIYIFIFILGFVAVAEAQTQKKYTLEDCIQVALENNLNLKSAKIRKTTADVNFNQSKADLLPTLNGNFNAGVNNGRSIDPFTNDFINQRLTFSSANLNLNAVIFNGFRLLNNFKQQRLNAKAADMEVEQEKQDLVLSVTLAYLQVLNSRDILMLSEQRLAATNDQLKVQKRMYDEGQNNPADYTDLLGQKASDETSVLSSQIALNNAKLELTQLLNLEGDIEIDESAMLLDLSKYGFSSDQVYQDALESLATFKARELRVEAAEKGINVARAQYIPEISIFGQLNTNYSSAAQTFSEVGSSIIETGAFVTVNNQNFSVFTEQTQFEAQQIDYFDQFENNLNSVVGISMRIPLFNGFQTKNNVALQKAQKEESLVEMERTQLQIKNAIKQVHFDMEAAYSRYQSFQKQVEAFEKSYEVNETRFINGVSNFLQYITSKNNLENARLNMSNAKYAYLLRVKVLEYYRGQVFKGNN
jgi:outer membrane protein